MPRQARLEHDAGQLVPVHRVARDFLVVELKDNPRLEDMALVRRGNRLSVVPVTDAQWRAVLAME
jgi:predicted RNA-binding protein with PUA-like domain